MPETDVPVRPVEPPALELPPVSVGLRALDSLVSAHGAPALLSASPRAAVVVRLLCAEACRADPGRAERLVIALRAAWPSLPAVRRLPAGDGSVALLERVITHCIAEFYRPRTAVPSLDAGDGCGRP